MVCNRAKHEGMQGAAGEGFRGFERELYLPHRRIHVVVGDLVQQLHVIAVVTVTLSGLVNRDEVPVL